MSLSPQQVHRERADIATYLRVGGATYQEIGQIMNQKGKEYPRQLVASGLRHKPYLKKHLQEVKNELH